MKKGIIALGLLGAIGLGTVMIVNNVTEPVVVMAEGEVEETKESVVIINQTENGNIEANILEGKEGDICQLNVKADMFYLINTVTVNGVSLIEDENIRGLYSFSLCKGENVVSASFVIDEELLGKLTNVYQDIKNEDWTSLFSVENIIRVISWLLEGGILIAVIRYFVKDKKLEEKLEKATKDTVEKIIPDSTREAVLAMIREIITPMFSQLQADNTELTKAMSVFAKCFALSQENSETSRIAIIEELSKLNISDETTLKEVRTYIEKLFADNLKAYEDTLAKIKEIGETNKEIIEEKEEKVF